MSWDSFCDEMGTDDALANLNRAQVEAVVDLLALMVYADGKMTILEEHEFEDQLHALPFLADKQEIVDARAKAAFERSKNDHSKDAFAKVIGTLADALAGLDVGAKIYTMAAELAWADLQLHANESEALAALALAFKLAPAEVEAINAKVS